MAGREITAGVVNDINPDADPMPFMDLVDWIDTLEFPEGREDLLAAMPAAVADELHAMGFTF